MKENLELEIKQLDKKVKVLKYTFNEFTLAFREFIYGLYL